MCVAIVHYKCVTRKGSDALWINFKWVYLIKTYSENAQILALCRKEVLLARLTDIITGLCFLDV